MSLPDDPRFAHIKFDVWLQKLDHLLVVVEERVEAPVIDVAKTLDVLGDARVCIAELRTQVKAAGVER